MNIKIEIIQLRERVCVREIEVERGICIYIINIDERKNRMDIER